MLEELTIKDFALIESDFLEFNRGFTVLSGETGAGKSILIGALSFLLGGKAEIQQIRTGSEAADVSGTFFLGEKPQIRNLTEDDEPENAWEWLELHGMGDQIENGRIILRRYIKSSGKSGAWIGSTPVTRADLAQFSSYLVDIHGQHEHQSLMKVTEHRKFLDRKAGISVDVDAFTKLYSSLVSKRRELEQFVNSENELKRKLEMAEFAVSEIENAKLKENEDVLLEEEEARLSSFEKIYSDVENINNVLAEDSSGSESIVSMLKKIRRDSAHAVSMDKSLSALDSRLESVFYEVSDIADEFSSYLQKLVFDPARLTEVQNRLSLIYGLKKKYASSVNAPLSEVMACYERAKVFLTENSEVSNKKSSMEKEIAVLEKKVLEAAKKLSAARKSAASVLEKQVEQILSKLGMNGTKFGVQVNEKTGTELEQKCGPYGIDDIEFLISANPGSPLLPLAKIASGGELSRVMLALKTIFAQSDSVDTLIFDEIDTGIGGEVAVAVGEHMKKLAQNKQIFCITHLASIAVYADNQIKIEKAVSSGITASNVYPVQGEARVAEIARMLSGDSSTEQSLEHARTMLNKYSGGY